MSREIQLRSVPSSSQYKMTAFHRRNRQLRTWWLCLAVSLPLVVAEYNRMRVTTVTTTSAWILPLNTGGRNAHHCRRTCRHPHYTATTFLRLSTTTTTTTYDDDTDEGIPIYPVPRKIDEALLGDLTGGRPGAIIETEEQLYEKELIISDIARGITHQDEMDILTEYYGTEVVDDDDEEGTDDADDSDAIDTSTWGTWTIQDLRAKFPYEYDPLDPNSIDPNKAQLQQPNTRYLKETPKDDDNVEIGYDPVFGPSNPLDSRTILGAIDSYMIDSATKNETMLEPQFPIPNDPEINYNEEIVQFRKSLDILETYTDMFLPHDMIIPRRVATWYGYPEPMYLTPHNFSHNRFTNLNDMTDFDSMTPYDARTKAVELARSKNAEWLPHGVSHEWHQSQRAPYERYQTNMGTLRRGDCDPELVSMIQPALSILGSCCQLLSIDGSSSSSSSATTDSMDDNNSEKNDGVGAFQSSFATSFDDIDEDDDMNDEDNEPDDLRQQSAEVASTAMISTSKTIYRFAYHGLMKNKYGMECWATTLLQDCGVPVTNVVFETGFRKRDPIYDGGDPWYAPIF